MDESENFPFLQFRIESRLPEAATPSHRAALQGDHAHPGRFRLVGLDE